MICLLAPLPLKEWSVSLLLKSTSRHNDSTPVQETRGHKTSKEKKKRESQPSLFQEAGEESRKLLLSPAAESLNTALFSSLARFF